jgi:hypothetical protein
MTILYFINATRQHEAGDFSLPGLQNLRISANLTCRNPKSPSCCRARLPLGGDPLRLESRRCAALQRDKLAVPYSDPYFCCSTGKTAAEKSGAPDCKSGAPVEEVMEFLREGACYFFSNSRSSRIPSGSRGHVHNNRGNTLHDSRGKSRHATHRHATHCRRTTHRHATRRCKAQPNWSSCRRRGRFQSRLMG